MKSAIIEAAEVIESQAESVRASGTVAVGGGRFEWDDCESREEYNYLLSLAQRLRDAADNAPIASCCGREECGGECGNEYRGVTSDAERRAEAVTSPPNKWQPLETAPRDNKRPLWLAEFNEDGSLRELDWGAEWRYFRDRQDEGGWGDYGWLSDSGRCEEPTHWAYMEEGT